MKNSLLLASILFVVVAFGTYFLITPSSQSQRIRDCALQCSAEKCRTGRKVAEKCVRICAGTFETLTMNIHGRCSAILRGMEKELQEAIQEESPEYQDQENN